MKIMTEVTKNLHGNQINEYKERFWHTDAFKTLIYTVSNRLHITFRCIMVAFLQYEILSKVVEDARTNFWTIVICPRRPKYFFEMLNTYSENDRAPYPFWDSQEAFLKY